MSDITGALRDAASSALRADQGVAAAFGTATVKIYTVPPPNAVEPYLVTGLGSVQPILAEGFDLSEVDFPVHVWSRPEPPSFDEAEAIAPAVRACMLGVEVSVGGRVYAAVPVRTEYLIDPSDNRTVHAVIITRFTTAPA